MQSRTLLTTNVHDGHRQTCACRPRSWYGYSARVLESYLAEMSFLDFSYYGGAESFAEGRSPRRTVIPSDNVKDAAQAPLGAPQDPSDFLWLMTEEPHRSRRMAIMKAHPEVRRIQCISCVLLSNLAILTKVTKLMGHEPLTKYVVLCVVSLQVALAINLRHWHPLSPVFIFCAYAIGGTANHNLFLAIHEITHNLAFKGIVANKALAIFANLPIGIPYSAAFKVGVALHCTYQHGF